MNGNPESKIKIPARKFYKIKNGQFVAKCSLIRTNLSSAVRQDP
jgi:hypothetical protein